jgi:acyl-CoA thioester hydrolase
MSDNDYLRARFRFFHPFRVRYSEIDGQGVVYNAHYLTFYDVAIHEYHRALGYDQFAEAEALKEDWHVVRALIEFKAPMPFDLEFENAVRITRIGNSSLTFALAIFPKGEDTLLATGELVRVYTDQRSHKAISIPAEVRDKFTAFEPDLR